MTGPEEGPPPEAPALRRSPEVTYEVVDGKAMLIDPAGTELLTLNAVGTLVWEALDGSHDVAELTDRLLPRLSGVSRVQLAIDINEFLAELRKAELVIAPKGPD